MFKSLLIGGAFVAGVGAWGPAYADFDTGVLASITDLTDTYQVLSSGGAAKEVFTFASLGLESSYGGPQSLELKFKLSPVGDPGDVVSSESYSYPKYKNGDTYVMFFPSLAAGNYNLTITAGSDVVANSVEYKLTGNVSAVPGPIAGAGLPALLGLLGFGAWARRKRVA